MKIKSLYKCLWLIFPSNLAKDKENQKKLNLVNGAIKVAYKINLNVDIYPKCIEEIKSIHNKNYKDFLLYI